LVACGAARHDSLQEPSVPTNPEQQTSSREFAAMVNELEEAEAYEVKLRQCIIDARDQLAAGHTSVALSILNTAINDIDAATDVVAGSLSGTDREQS
jgi:hypothetical protein